MKTKLFSLLCIIALFTSCSMMKSDYSDIMPPESSVGEPGADNGSDGEGQQGGEAGRVTAGEWNDLSNWLFWSNLMTSTQADQEGNNFSQYSNYWSLFTNNRIAVNATSQSGLPLYDAVVSLQNNNGTTLWTARTDKEGNANLWIGMSQLTNEIDTSSLFFAINGQRIDGAVKITGWGEEVKINNLVASQTIGEARNNLDVAFIVDATGSMADEINFLKADLESIINEVSSKSNTSGLRTSAVFYRDEGDDYVTRVSDFSASVKTTTDFISRQSANGGGDYPEYSLGSEFATTRMAGRRKYAPCFSAS